MNKRILNKEVQDFINDNLRSNLTQLIFKGSPFKDVSIQEIAEQITSKLKSEKKLPTWFSNADIYYPPKVNLEQTSSELTAQYKASLVKGGSLIDLTGGFGVDSYAFSREFSDVIHCEKNEVLTKISKHNFEILKAHNIQVVNMDALEYLQKSRKVFDCIFVDPSRRHDKKGKVFLLEDCEPNLPKNLDLLFEYSSKILIKTSPILDISSAINELKFVKEVHVVAVKNEVKELVFLLKNDYSGSIQIKTINFEKNNTQKLRFMFGEEASSEYSSPLNYLYEPNSAILKSGGFHQVSNQLKVLKLHEHSHLYTSEKLIDFPGRKFEILSIIPYDKKQIKKTLKENKANITIRNFPKTVAQIRKELKLKDGGNDYLFFTKDLNSKNICLICKKA